MRRTPVGAREVQRDLGLSSPSVAWHHLEKLRELGLLRKNARGEYTLAKIALILSAVGVIAASIGVILAAVTMREIGKVAREIGRTAGEIGKASRER